jgi:hypothetical protein
MQVGEGDSRTATFAIPPGTPDCRGSHSAHQPTACRSRFRQRCCRRASLCHRRSCFAGLRWTPSGASGRDVQAGRRRGLLDATFESVARGCDRGAARPSVRVGGERVPGSQRQASRGAPEVGAQGGSGARAVPTRSRSLRSPRGIAQPVSAGGCGARARGHGWRPAVVRVELAITPRFEAALGLVAACLDRRSRNALLQLKRKLGLRWRIGVD